MPIVNCVILDKQLYHLYNIKQGLNIALLKQIIPKQDPNILSKELPSFIKLLVDKKQKQK